MPAVASGYKQRRRIHASHMRRRIHACGSIGIHASHMRRRIHANHMRRRIHACGFPLVSGIERSWLQRSCSRKCQKRPIEEAKETYYGAKEAYPRGPLSM